MKSRPLGRTGLQLSPFGLSLDEGLAGPHPAPVSANWCDMSADIDKPDWARLSASLPAGNTIVQARVGPGAWDRHMMTVCETLLAQTRLDTIHLWQLDGFDLERIKGGEPFSIMLRLRDAGRIRFFSVRVQSPNDALWLIDHTPVHSITLDADLNTPQWRELIGIAEQAGIGLIATFRCVNGSAAEAWRLLHETSITGFAWPLPGAPTSE